MSRGNRIFVRPGGFSPLTGGRAGNRSDREASTVNEADWIDTKIIDALKSKDRQVQNDALKLLEPWLRLLARLQMESRLKRKFDTSDIVQETMTEALRALPDFHGRSRGEILAWLRRILAHVLAHQRRHHEAAKRDARKEVSLDAELGDATRVLARVLGTSAGSPTKIAEAAEREVRLAIALDRLSEDHREVIVLRTIQSLPFEEVAQRMDRSSGAVRMLWGRAIAEMGKALKDLGITA